VSGLLLDLSFVVIDGVWDPARVAEALPWEATFLHEGDRREALFETLHGSDGERCNEVLFAIFSHGTKTLVARPADRAVTGAADFECALSEGFGEAWMFQTSFGCGLVRHCRAGEIVGTVDSLEVSPASGVVGITAPIPDASCEDIMAVHLPRLVGAPWAAIFPRRGARASFWTLG
jgi:hypothetical protein